MKIKILISVLIVLAVFLLAPSVMSCSSPIFYNEYGVPISLYGGGFIVINGDNYPPEQLMIDYNITVRNTDDDNGITIYLTPTGLNGYMYVESSYYIPAGQTGNLTLQVYVDGPDKSGTIFVTGACDDSFGMPDGVIVFGINGRGNAAPQTCNNNVLSCGVWPNCQDISQYSGCSGGYMRNYYCADNSIMYSESCTNFCCKEKNGETGFCGSGICKGTPPACYDDCDFFGTTCIDGDAYSCEVQLDGCKDIVLHDECVDECLGGECFDANTMSGKIAYLCRSDECNDNIEGDVSNWLESTGWMVIGKSRESWTDDELDNFDMMVCSDQTLGCKLDEGTVAHDKHKNQGMPLLEVADNRYAHAAYRLDYVNNPYEFLEVGDELYRTQEDLITTPFVNPIKIFPTEEKMVIVADYRLEDNVIDLLDIETDHRRTTGFKVKEDGNHGRYAYVGWFYKGLPDELTVDGFHLFNRTVLWVECGDECLSDGAFNYPPVALATITPSPIAYVNQEVEFDASSSYDPEGEPLTYSWDFGDGSGTGWVSNPVSTHTYTEPGEYDVSLIVNDGDLDSDPLAVTLTVLPEIGNSVALVCGDDSCSEASERRFMDYLESKGFDVEGRSESSWGSDLMYYDFMACTSIGGCNVHSFSDVYKKHSEGMTGFLEVPDYNYLRAAYKFGYTSWWSGYRGNDDSANVVGVDDITEGYSGDTVLFTTEGDMGSVFHRSMRPAAKNLIDVNGRGGASTEFKVDADGSSGRYAYVGWIYKSHYDDLTSDGDELLMRTIRWVQCGNVDSCE